MHFFPLCFGVVEKELNFGDHGYARRTPLPGLEEEDADRTSEDQQPCTHCQLLRKQLEQEMQHTARLQKEVGQLMTSPANQSLVCWASSSFFFGEHCKVLLRYANYYESCYKIMSVMCNKMAQTNHTLLFLSG